MPAITDVTELQAMNDDLAGTYWLSNDIDAVATSGWNGGAGFIPIGTLAVPFTGTFDAKHYEISDLSITRAATDEVGLFGHTDGATIQKVRLIDCAIVGDDSVGALVGDARDGIMTDCQATGEISADVYIGGLIGFTSGMTITSCSSACTVGGEDFIGGLIGWAYNSTLSQCYASGAVTAADDYAGGLLGVGQQNDIDDCYARGAVDGDRYIGGLIGYSYDASETVDDCYSTGAVTGNTDVGGLMGFSSSVVSNCFWDTETSGQAASAAGTGKTTAEMKVAPTFTAAGWDFTVIWGLHGTMNDGYPFFWAIPPAALPDAPRATVAVEDKITLETIRNIEMAAGGRFYINAEGKATYKSRYARNA